MIRNKFFKKMEKAFLRCMFLDHVNSFDKFYVQKHFLALLKKGPKILFLPLSQKYSCL